jgi:hypothetical protein
VKKTLLVVALVLAAVALPAQATPGHDSGAGTIRGVVYDATCYGPCQYPPPPPRPYTRDNLVVTVRTLPGRKLVARLHPKEGRFRVKVRPGAYRVRAFIGDGGNCWEGEAKDVKVAEGQTTGVRLRVYNACIV